MNQFFQDANRILCIVKLTNTLPVLRASLNLSQEELAEYVGMSRKTINSIENKKRIMTWSSCMTLMAFFMTNRASRNFLIDNQETLDVFNQAAKISA